MSIENEPTKSERGRGPTCLAIIVGITVISLFFATIYYIYQDSVNIRQEATQAAMAIENAGAERATLEYLGTPTAAAERTARAATFTAWPELQGQTLTAEVAPVHTGQAATQEAAPQQTSQVIGQATQDAATAQVATATVGAVATAYAIEQHYQTAVRYMEQGFWDAARTELLAVLEGDPNYKDASERLEEVEGQLANSLANTTPSTPAYAWIQRNPLMSPSARGYYNLIYSNGRNAFVLFGGFADDRQLNDTWEWRDGRWWEIAIGAPPAPRDGAIMVYDTARNVAVLFGGRGPEARLSDTWEYDGEWADVTQESETVPPARSHACAAYDEARQQVVMFGGRDEQSELDETWTYTNGVWQLMEDSEGEALATAPSARTGCAMTYYPPRKTVILFGGTELGFSKSDTWEWDGAEWTLLKSISSPLPRGFHGMFFHDAINRIVMFGGDRGGCSPYLDTWTFDGEDWFSMDVTHPGTRAMISIAYDPVRNAAVLFGGWTLQAGVCTAINDTFEFVYR